RTGTQADLDDAQRRVEMLQGRPAEGWWMAAIVGSSLIIGGYELFAIAGALAAAVAALFVGSAIEQGARRRHEAAVAEAQDELRAANAKLVSEDAEVFSASEEASGEREQSAELLH